MSCASRMASLRRTPGLERLVVKGLVEAEVMTLLEAIGRPWVRTAGTGPGYPGAYRGQPALRQ
jgi:hypothetical protein